MPTNILDALPSKLDLVTFLFQQSIAADIQGKTPIGKEKATRLRVIELFLRFMT
jgi:hypothetical protein